MEASLFMIHFSPLTIHIDFGQCEIIRPSNFEQRAPAPGYEGWVGLEESDPFVTHFSPLTVHIDFGQYEIIRPSYFEQRALAPGYEG